MSGRGAMIELDGVSKRYDGAPAVDRLSLAIAEGEFCALVGPSGSGKSTTLRMINRLVERSEGTIRFAGRDVREFPAEELRRRMGYAIQSIGLFPHWTVARNVATVPALLGWPRERVRARVGELMALLRLDADRMLDRYPHELSGGQQQRVGVARALAADPDVLLMDEPFGALDPITRATLQDGLARIHRDTGKTIVFVTHDIEEALGLATRIAVLDRGRLAQAGTPAELLTRPQSDFVRRFVGHQDLGIRLLALETVAARVRPGDAGDAGAPVPASATLREALSEMIVRGIGRLPVVDAAGHPLGHIRIEDLARR